MASLIKRGKIWYAQISLGTRTRRVSLKTTSLQVAKEKIRQIESAQARQDELPIPTRTPLGEVLGEYVAYMKGHKTVRSVRADVFYLRCVNRGRWPSWRSALMCIRTRSSSGSSS